MPQSPEMIEWLNQVIKGTESGSIKWKSANPTTFAWDTRTGQSPARVVLQRVERMENVVVAGRMTSRKVPNFLLQAIQIPNPQQPGQQIPVVTITGADDPEMNAQLGKLYGLVMGVAGREHIEFLKSLLPSK
jgi:hypothetical protein